MLSSILHSTRGVHVNIAILCAFLQLGDNSLPPTRNCVKKIGEMV